MYTYFNHVSLRLDMYIQYTHLPILSTVKTFKRKVALKLNSIIHMQSIIYRFLSKKILSQICCL